MNKKKIFHTTIIYLVGALKSRRNKIISDALYNVNEQKNKRA